MLESMALVALGGVLIALAVYFALEVWLRAWDRRLLSPLSQILYRVGADPLQLAAAGAAREIATAERRCPDCPNALACRAWLESGGSSGYRNFCPSAGLVERLTGS